MATLASACAWVATYTDRRGDNKTAEFVSLYPVRPAKVEDNTAPEFATTAITRDIQEGGANRNVGASVTATDADGDVLNYTVVSSSPQINGANAFKIDQATGQIMTAIALDYDADGATRTFTVIVRATDSARGVTVASDGNDATPDDATVTITLLNVNDAPGFVAPDPDPNPNADVANNVAGMAVDKAEEGNGVTWTAAVSDYGVDDPEGVNIGQGKWSLEGADAALFKLTGTTDNIRTLEFIDKADFEMPMDSNRDNIYEVTVVASDGQEMAKRAVTVKITDSDEAGMIMLSDENPVTGTAVVATFEDSDGDVINVNWMWYALASVPDSDGAIGAATALKDAESMGATSSYTPTPDDIGMHLVARAMYMDRTEDENNTDEVATVPGEGAIRFNNMATSEVTAAVIDDPANAAPEFVEGATSTRYVEENSDDERPNRAPSETIGTVLMISDDDGIAAGSHTYMLGGTDAASFEVNAVSDTTNGIHGAQLMTKAALDYETKKTYTVVVTVKDSSNESNDSDSITVTIEVKDLDERPVIQKGGLNISGMASVEYAEGRMDAVDTYTAAGPRADMATWTLEGDDAGAFTIRGGVLEFMTSPDYEMPADADMDNTYMVTIKANDGTYMDTQEVMVMVTNVDEIGTLSGPQTVSDYMENGDDAVGTYTVSGGSMSEMANLTLMGDDAGDFMLSSDGMLKFSSAPDFEMPRGRAMSDTNTNTYMVTVKAEAGGEMAMQPVTVTVTNEEEDGTVTLSPMTPVVGTQVTAMLMDPDMVMEDSVTWQWSRSMDMAGTFMDIDGATMMSYTPVADDDGYHLRAMATYTDGYGGDTAMATTTGMVTTVQDQPGTVTLSPMDPVVGVELTASLSDADGSVTEDWQWSKSMDMSSWTDISGATSMSYTPVDVDVDHYLQATVTYTDNHGPDVKTETAMTTAKVVADADALLVARYDTNPTNGMIDKAEVIAAINDYLFGEGDAAITKAEVIKLINLYLFGP